MLEPLIVLTVLNCFFMFSSTVTTCALWWQYRSHRCCFKKDPMQQTAKHALSKLKSSYAAKTSKKSGNPKQDNAISPTKDQDGSKSNSTVNRDGRKGRSSKQKTKSSFRHSMQNGSPGEVSSLETMWNWDLEDKTRMSEASQTGNDAKSAVVMEYSTVQKIVQILDDDTDLVATKLAIKDLNSAKQNIEEKKPDYVFDAKFEPSLMSDFVPPSQSKFH